jgi:uncharacterized membrane protein YesL
LSILWSVPPALVVAGLTLGTSLGRGAFIVGWVFMGPATAAAWSVAAAIVRRDPVSPRSFPAALRMQWLSGLLFFLVDGGIGWLLVANVQFYLGSTLGVLGRPLPALGEGMRVGHLVGFLWLAPLVLWALAQIYALPLLVADRRGVGAALRRAALLVVDNVWFTLALAVIVVGLSGLLILTGVGAFVLLPGLLAVLTTNATQTLLARYQEVTTNDRRPTTNGR